MLLPSQENLAQKTLIKNGPVSWGQIKETAEKTAKETAEKIVKEWLGSEAPELIQKQVDLLTDTTLGPGNDGTAADDIGNQAG